ncbi:MAG: hypothetical protein PVJ57_21740 [Phycisphaerae bacterium]
MSKVLNTRILASVVVCALILPAAWAEELHVPGVYATIQAAIDAAQPGDEVVIAVGTYTGPGNRDLDFAGKAITVRSTDPNDPDIVATTVIDCEAAGRGFRFQNNEGPDSVLAGLTIMNGYVEGNGGGILCDTGSPIITKCHIDQNTALGYGGGIRCEAGCPTVSACYISGNTTEAASGGGIHCGSGSPLIIDCVIRQNSVLYDGVARGGGGIHCGTANPTIANCTITANESAWGAGIAASGDNWAVVRDCTINNNECRLWGAGITTYGGALDVSNCSISGNDGVTGGGVACIYEGVMTLTDCTISGNTAHYGGGFYCQDGSLTLTHCTITENTASENGGAVHCISGNTTLHNCIVWQNSTYALYRAACVMGTYSDIQDGWVGTGNIDEDPLFVDRENGDFHLSPDSPCIDAGAPTFVPSPGVSDMDGQYRLWDGDEDGVAIVDMGADEFGSYVLGDVTCDGAINNFDIRAFVLAITNPDTYAERYPNCNAALGDLTGDGLVNNFDISPFLALLAGG